MKRKNPRGRKAAEAARSQQVTGTSRKAEDTSRGKAIELAQSQISQTQQTAYPGGRNSASRKACWSDSDSPQSKFAKYDSESVGDFTIDGLKLFQSVFGVRKSVVFLCCTVGEGELCCSGTVIDHDLGKTWILTSACLVRRRGTQLETYDHFKIEVFLPNGKTVEGSLEMCNLHYNIAIVTIESPEYVFKLPAVELSEPPECYSLQPRPVVALGRDAFSQAFLMRYGVLARKSIELDCKELLFSTCDISPNFVGGPVMDHESRFIGITNFYEKTALILPVEIASRCLKYFKKEKTIPWLRIKGQALHTLDIDVLESICCNFARPPSGVLVDKICDISTENYGGIKVGDIITELDGVTICSTAQFTATFLDKLEVATGTVDTVTVKAVVQRCTDKSTFVAKLNARQVASDEFDKSYLNRWVLWRRSGFHKLSQGFQVMTE